MQVGTPAQNLRLLPSNSGNAIWPVLPQGCIVGDPSDCSDLRGTLFLPNTSSTWDNLGLYDLFLPEEWPLGYSGNANFGYDNLTLGWPGGGLPALSHQIIEGFATKDFYIGSLGLSPSAINITTLDDPQPSFLGALAQQNKTPSTSWAYTAGAYYRQPTAFGSLTLGGYDTTRFVQNNVTFPFGPDTSRDLIVPIRSITSDAASSPLLSDVIYAYIDSLVPQIWLPLDVCEDFERAFGLTYNETAELYFVNDTLHDKLVSQNPNVTFTLGLDSSAGNDTVDIVMHYGSFDLTADYPIVNNATRYFPLKRAQNDSQYTLGRAFLQDAYVIADYDRSNFSVSQAVFPNGSNAQQIIAIHRPGDIPPATSRKALSTGSIIGIAVTAVVSSSIIVIAIIRYGLRKRTKAKTSSGGEGMDNEPEPGNGEVKNTRQSRYLEMPVTEPKELTATEARRPELPAQPPFPVFEIPEPTPELGDATIAPARGV
ncbi:hypothetical protein IMSHALPRED_003931 [Imshaugia aleurites]|uniref:Peptidase A1 domain-containing protein n=1 Tax=Imshaugia aleurites TaxID=172621 RepID=A0A8H3EMP8_9LECA|nr:hypothetical protein IMSHALPRED_003931 [Imshaugia aleurites]